MLKTILESWCWCFEVINVMYLIIDELLSNDGSLFLKVVNTILDQLDNWCFKFPNKCPIFSDRSHISSICRLLKYPICLQKMRIWYWYFNQLDHIYMQLIICLPPHRHCIQWLIVLPPSLHILARFQWPCLY